MLNAPLAAAVNVPEVTLSVQPVPVLVIFRSEKVTTPLTAARLKVPDRIPPPGFDPIAIVTVPVKPVAVLLNESRAVTTTPPEPPLIEMPAVVLVGWPVNASVAATPDVTVTVSV